MRPSRRARIAARLSEGRPALGVSSGCMVLLEAGNLVPADGRVVESASLRVQEAVLTGESEAVEKRSTAILEDGSPALGDQANMAFMGTSVAYGRGQVLVTATGGATELGRVASLLQSVGSVATPLQRRLNRLGRVLAAAALAVVGAIFGLGLLLRPGSSSSSRPPSSTSRRCTPSLVRRRSLRCSC